MEWIVMILWYITVIQFKYNDYYRSINTPFYAIHSINDIGFIYLSIESTIKDKLLSYSIRELRSSKINYLLAAISSIVRDKDKEIYSEEITNKLKTAIE